MNKKLALLIASSHKINRQHIQLVFVLISLTMLVLGVGAPADGGNIGR